MINKVSQVTEGRKGLFCSTVLSHGGKTKAAGASGHIALAAKRQRASQSTHLLLKSRFAVMQSRIPPREWLHPR